MARLILTILVLAVAETAWALFAAETSVNLLVFYAVLVAASAVFFVPGVAESGGRPPRGHPA
jgi:hypothetical protein